MFREISGTSNFHFTVLPSLQSKIDSKVLRMGQFTNLFCLKIGNTVTILVTYQKIFGVSFIK